MSTLLETAINAHGGLDRWNSLNTVALTASITGAIWHLKGRPDVLREIQIEVDLRSEKLRTHFPKEEKNIFFTPDRISIETVATPGAVIFEKPINSFKGHVRDTPWEDVHVAYFSGEALWTYLTAPFLYTYPGFQIEELSPWQEDGEIWRRLKVIFPENIASHCREQISYFGPDGLLRRHDYTVDILGGATGANYAADYKDFNGIMVPTSRRVYSYDAENNKVPAPLLVAIDIHQLSFA